MPSSTLFMRTPVGAANGPAPSMNPLITSTLGPMILPSLICFMRSNKISLLPMSRTWVTPAAMCKMPSVLSAKCTCISHRPGKIVLPFPSITNDSPFWIFFASVIFWITPLWISTSLFGSTLALTASKMETPVIRMSLFVCCGIVEASLLKKELS